MFNYLLKNIPAQYAFGGYAVRKSTSVVSTDVNGELLFDVFTYTYLDTQITMFILMEDGTYKSVEYDKIRIDFVLKKRGKNPLFFEFKINCV